MTILYVALAVLLLGILVGVHEFGHFISARACGIEVQEFSLGFGPKIFSRTGRRGTLFSLRVIPFGGYCAFYGEDDTDGSSADDPRAYTKQPVWKRMISVLMGPGMNFILAYVVMFVYLMVSGAAVVQPVIAGVEAGSPAEAAGLRAGDVVLSIDGASVEGTSLDPFLNAVRGWRDGDAPLRMAVQREEGPAELEMTPAWDAEEGRYRVGVTVQGDVRKETLPDGSVRAVTVPYSVGEGLRCSWDTCVEAGGLILGALRDLVTTGRGFEDTSGPVGVVSIVTDQVRTGGARVYFELMVIISINLGIMNLLPIPGLDGSRFLFMLVEAVRGRPVDRRREAYVHLGGTLLLFGVLIFFTFRDILKLFH